MATILNPSTAPAGGCGCGPGHERCDDPAGLVRPRFFAGQLLGPEDFVQEQRYLRDKHRRHNRALHGWGIVCGVDVRPAASAGSAAVPFTVCVAPGYVLGPYGDEIVVDDTVAFDVRRAADELRGDCPPPRDPWCSPVRADRDPSVPLYLAIRYDECETQPVQTESGCGCGSECEYSRIADGFALGVLDELPRIYVDEEREDAAGRRPALEGTVGCSPEMREHTRPCVPCPTSPWVILADLTVDGDGTVSVERTHRRYVASFASYGFYCRPAAAPAQPTSALAARALDVRVNG